MQIWHFLRISGNVPFSAHLRKTYVLFSNRDPDLRKSSQILHKTRRTHLNKSARKASEPTPQPLVLNFGLCELPSRRGGEGWAGVTRSGKQLVLRSSSRALGNFTRRTSRCDFGICFEFLEIFEDFAVFRKSPQNLCIVF